MAHLIFIIPLLFLVSEGVVHYLARSGTFEKPDLIVFLGSSNKVNSPMLNDRLLKLLETHEKFPDVPILISGNEEIQEVSSVMAYIGQKIPATKLAIHSTATRTFD